MYINYADPSLGGAESAERYYGGNVQRLREVKKNVDPREVFSYSQAIKL